MAGRVLGLGRALLLLLLLLRRRRSLGWALGPEQLGRVRVGMLEMVGLRGLVMLDMVGRGRGEGRHEVFLAAAHHVDAGLQEDDAAGARAHGQCCILLEFLLAGRWLPAARCAAKGTNHIDVIRGKLDTA